MFVDWGNIDSKGTIQTSDEEIQSFLNFTKDQGFNLIPYTEVICKDFNFFDGEFQRNLINSYVKLNNLGFNGALVDVEAIRDNSENEGSIARNQEEQYLKFLDNLRAALPNKPIFAYAGMLNEHPNEWEWSPALAREVSKRGVNISISSYDTGIKNKREYQDYINDQFGQWASLNLPSKLFLTVPTHKNNDDPSSPETIENCLETFCQNPASNYFSGAVLIFEYTTDDKEWKIFNQYFNNN